MTMPGNDEVIYHSAHSDNNHQGSDNIHRLVTLERSQKLDLLIHLINNMSQSLVVCGPEGIGKTSLLKMVQEQRQEHWRIIWIDGSDNLSFERLTERLLQELTDVEGTGLAEKLAQMDRRQQKLVWIIDNAGLLVPGLISALIQFAKPYDCLRLIFALTHDELHLKNSSDPEISECHLIEIPPLNQQHYTAFLQNLSAGQGALNSFNAINEGLVENLYRKTHGIPGKIIEKLPRLSHYKKMSPLAWGSTLAIIAGLAIAGGLLYLNKPATDAKSSIGTDITETVYKKQPVDVAVSTPVIQHEAVSSQYSYYTQVKTAQTTVLADKVDNKDSKKESIASPPKNIDADIKKLEQEEIVQPVVVTGKTLANPSDKTLAVAKNDTDNTESTTETNLPVTKTEDTPLKVEQKAALADAADTPDKVAVKEVSVLPQQVKPETTKPLEKSEIKKAPGISKQQEIAWLEQRNPKHFTLQIMVLTQLSGVKKLIKQYPLLQQKAHYFPVQRQGKQHYVVVLGDYVNRSAAQKARKTLPKPLAKAWIRSFKILQQQTKTDCWRFI